MIACPSEKVLRAALAQELSAVEDQSCLQHVESCLSCQQMLEQVVSGNGRSARLLVQAAAALETPRGLVADTGPYMPNSDPFATVAPSPKDMTSAPAPAIPGYEVLKELGRGGMGVVYLARQTQLNRLVALKMVLGGKFAGPEELARFRTEAVAVAQLQHPNIVQIHEVGTLEGIPFFSLEYLAGGNLAERLRGQPLPARTAATLLQPLAEAVHAAHLKGIIHRDLKPANILLQMSNEEVRTKHENQPLQAVGIPQASLGIPKIADFGLAKKFDADGSATATGVLMGTPDYMAPEQAGGQRNLGPSVDIFALGVMLYEMLTGRSPFRGTDPLETLHRVRTEEPVPPSRLMPGLPRDLETVCLKCLQKELPRRYLTAQELAADLHRFLTGEPVRARPVGPVARTVKWAKRKPVVAALLGALMLALAGLSVAVVMLAQANQLEATLREQAQTNEQKAFANERKAVRYQQKADQVVNDLFVAVSENDLLRPDSMREVRLLLLEKALPYYQAFRQERGDDPDLMVETAINQGRVALVLQEKGEWEKARLAYEEALALWEKALLAKPDLRHHRIHLAKLWHGLGQMQNRTGRTAEAEQNHRRAAALLEKLAGEQPDDHDVMAASASVHTSLAGMHGSEDRFTQALKMHRKLAEKHPDNPGHRANLARTWAQFAVWQSGRGQPAEAEKAYGEAIRLLDKVVTEHPDQAEFRDLLSVLLTSRGLLHIHAKRLDAANADLERALKLSTGLTEEFPTVAKYQHHEAQTWTNLGLVHVERGRFQEALACFEKNLARLTKLAQENPQALEYQLDFGTALSNRGLLALNLNQPRDALVRLDRAIGHLSQVLHRWPNHRSVRHSLRNAFLGRGRVFDALENHPEAAKAWEQAIEHDDYQWAFLRTSRIKSLARASDAARALAEAQRLQKTIPLAPPDKVELARGCALASVAAGDNHALHEQLVTLALDLLGQLLWPKPVVSSQERSYLKDKDPAFGSLRARRDFQELFEKDVTKRQP